MADKKISRRGEAGGRGETQRADGGFRFRLQYSTISMCVQSLFYRVGMRMAVLLADLADALAGAVWRMSNGGGC